MMGCSVGDEECFPDEKPAHRVTLTNGFWLGQTEVTQAAWTRVMGRNPSSSQGTELPVESVDWRESQKYCTTIGGRLPTEAEWEYAAGAGSGDVRYEALTGEIAWYLFNSDQKTREVKGKRPNAWGIYDMLGNVSEWVLDWYSRYSADAVANPSMASSGYSKVIRGGAVNTNSRSLRVSSRVFYTPEGRSSTLGFRCVLESIPLVGPR
jgi:formylglycine-generating enzyme required for sulfatase activity